MDSSVFDAAGGEDSPTLSELAALIDADLRVPVAGAVAVVKRLLQFAVLILTLSACVLLYIFLLAWICLFWAQSRLLNLITNFLDRCMSKTVAARTTKLSSRIHTSSATNVKLANTTKTHTCSPDQTASHSALSTEFHDAVERQEHITPTPLQSPITDTHNGFPGDYDAILRDILLREKAFEAEIHELATSVAVPHSVQIVNEAVNGLRREEDDSTIVQKSAMNSAPQTDEYHSTAVRESATEPTPLTDELEKHSKKLPTVSRPPQAATFKLTTRKKVEKPRIDYAEQLKEKKAQAQLLFVNHMKGNSIIPSKTRNDEMGITDAEHLKSVWSNMNAAKPAHSTRPTMIGKTKSATEEPTPRSTQWAAKPRSTRALRSINAPTRPPTVPPHVRSSPEAKAKRTATKQHAYDGMVKETAAVPTRNTFAFLSDEAATADTQDPTQGGDVAPHATFADEDDASPAPIQDPPLTLFEQVNVDLDEAGKTPQPEKPNDLANGTNEDIKECLISTLDAMKAINIPLTEAQYSTVFDRLEDAELCNAHHMASAKSRSVSPNNFATGSSKFFDSKNAEASSTHNGIRTSPAKVLDATLQAHTRSPVLQDGRKCSLPAISEAQSVEPAEQIKAVHVPTGVHTYPTALSTSATADLEGLDFFVKLPLDTKLSNPYATASTRTLPITPGPLSFFARKVIEKENEASAPQQSTNPGRPLHGDAIAFNPYAPGSLRSNTHQPFQMPLHPYSPYYHWAEPHVLNLAFEESFPTLGAARPGQTKISISKPPGLGMAHPDTQAACDALLPVSVPSQRSSNLGQFISTATTVSAVTEVESTVQAHATSIIPPFVVQGDTHLAPETPYMKYEARFPELPKADLPSTQVGDGPSQKKTSVAAKKLAREDLKEAWCDREEARKKLVACYSLEDAKDLIKMTTLYLEKRSTLASLMTAGVLNDTDAAAYPQFGMLDLAVPKMKALTDAEWRSRKLKAKALIANETAPFTPVAPPDENKVTPAIKEMADARENRQQSIEAPRPPIGTIPKKWLKARARADKVYIQKRKMLEEAYPAGLPAELELRFPQISLMIGPQGI